MWNFILFLIKKKKDMVISKFRSYIYIWCPMKNFVISLKIDCKLYSCFDISIFCILEYKMHAHFYCDIKCNSYLIYMAGVTERDTFWYKFLYFFWTPCIQLNIIRLMITLWTNLAIKDMDISLYYKYTEMIIRYLTSFLYKLWII